LSFWSTSELQCTVVAAIVCAGTEGESHHHMETMEKHSLL